MHTSYSMSSNFIRRRCCMLGVVVAASASGVHAQLHFETVAISSNQLSLATRYAIGENGEPAYWVFGPNYSAVMVGPAIAGQELLRTGTSVDGIGPFSDVVLYAFRNRDNHVLSVHPPTGLVARAGTEWSSFGIPQTQAPDSPPGVLINSTGSVALNAAGEVAFGATLSGATPATWRAIFAGMPDNLHTVARLGSQAPDMPVGFTYATLEYISPGILNNNSQIAFTAGITGPGLGDSAWAIYAGPITDVHQVAYVGGPASTFGSGVTYDGLSYSELNDAGDVAFGAQLIGNGINSSNNGVLILRHGTTEKVIARSGDAAPNAGVNVKYASPSLYNIYLNDAGGILYDAYVRTGESTQWRKALFAGPIDQPMCILQAGDAAPGISSGITIADFDRMIYNERGQAVFTTSLSGSGVNSNNDLALFYYDPSVGNLLIAREGSMFDLGGGIQKQISTLNFLGGHEGYLPGLSDAGSAIFWLRFNDFSSGIFTVSIPEPRSILFLLGLASIAFSGQQVRIRAEKSVKGRNSYV